MNCNGSRSSTSSYVVIKIFSLLVTPLLNAPLVLIMVSVVIKSSNHRPISQSLIYWDLISTFVSLVLLSTAMLVAVGGLNGSSWSAPRRGEKNWRASLSGLKITQNKTSSNHRVRPHRSPCYGPRPRTNDDSVYSLLSIYSMFTVAIWLEIGLRGRKAIWNVGVENCHLSAYVAHHGR